jgi:ribonuclease E
MAGLVVIDFIDMEQSGHIRKVEKAMKEALKNDRARIQVGRISSFGLMEMSRQRLRTGVLEASTKPCPHCEGSGLMRTAASAGLSALRMLEDEAARGRGSRICLRAGREAAIYLLNKKRGEIGEVEDRYGVDIEVVIDEGFEGARMSVESVGPPPTFRPAAVQAPLVDEADDLEPEFDEEIEEEEAEEEPAPQQRSARREERPERGEREERGEGGGRKRRRRRGRRGGRREEGEERQDGHGQEGQALEAGDEGVEADAPQATPADEQQVEAPAEAPAQPELAQAATEEEAKPTRGRRRPRARKADQAEAPAAPTEAVAEAAPAPEASAEGNGVADDGEAPAEPAPKPRRSRGGRGRKAAATEAPAEAAPAAEADGNGSAVEAAPAAPIEATEIPLAAKLDAHAGNGTAAADSPEAPMLERQTLEGGDEAETAGAAGPPRRGWWQRTFGG